jgi:sugar phosphate isomerase/epimerase
MAPSAGGLLDELSAETPGGPVSDPPALDNPFFAMCIGMHDPRHRTPEAKAQLLAELGYDGLGHIGLRDVPETLESLNAYGLKLHAVYAGIEIDPDRPAYEPQLPEVLGQLKGHDTVLLLHVRSRRLAPSSPAGEGRAVRIVREVSAMAARSEVRVALYPHEGLWLERVEHAVRLAKLANRKNVGVAFNLCHWLKLGDSSDYTTRLREAMPRLFLVTLNGASREGTSWQSVIQPLDRGDFDIPALLRVLKRLGYDGPVGLQCYGLKGDERENLRRSMAAWRRYCREVAEEP